MSLLAYIEKTLTQVGRPYQREWFKTCLTKNYVGILGARQIGKSWALGLVALALANGGEFWGKKIRPHNVLIVSKDRETAKNIIAMIRKHLNTAEAAWGRRFDTSGIGGVGDVYLSSGGRIVAMPGTPRSLQGFTGSIIWDEVSANRWDMEEGFAQALSVTSGSPDFRLILASNADVSGSWVDQFWHNPEWAKRREGWKLNITTILDAYPKGLPPRLKTRQVSMSPAMWSRYYMCQFPGLGAGVIPRSQLSIHAKLSQGRGQILMGIDPGFSETGNPTGICIVEIDSGGVKVLHSDHWFGLPLEMQVLQIENLRKKYAVSKIYVDQGGPGWHLAQRVQGANKVSVGRDAQERWFQSLVDLVEGGRISFADGPVVDDVCSIIWDQNGRIIVPQRPVQGGKGRIHGDAALALLYLMEDCVKGTKASTVAVKRLPKIRASGWVG